MSQSTIPGVLAAPPWVPARRRPKITLPDLVPEPRVVWPAGEHEEWLGQPAVGTTADPLAKVSPDERDRQILDLIERRGILRIDAAMHLSERGLFAALAVADDRYIEHYGLARLALARHGLEALPDLLALLSRAPGSAVEALLNVDAMEVGLALAKAPEVFRAWSERYPRTAAHVLVRDAVLG